MKFQFSFISKSVAAAALAFSASTSFALVPMDEQSAGAACETLFSQLAEAQKTKDPVLAQKVIEQGRSCNDQVAEAFDALRSLKSEYFIFGLGVIVAGVEINTPTVIAGGLRFGLGASVFISDERNLGFTFTRVLVPNLQWSISGAKAQPVEPQWGFIAYIGSKKTKSINQFDGLYGGAGLEMPNFRFSEQLNRSSLALNGFVNHEGSIVVMGTKSFTAGAKTTAISIQALDLRNQAYDGGGYRVGQMFGAVWANVAKAFWGVYNLTASKTSQAFGQ